MRRLYAGNEQDAVNIFAAPHDISVNGDLVRMTSALKSTEVWLMFSLTADIVTTSERVLTFTPTYGSSRNIRQRQDAPIIKTLPIDPLSRIEAVAWVGPFFLYSPPQGSGSAITSLSIQVQSSLASDTSVKYIAEVFTKDVAVSSEAELADSTAGVNLKLVADAAVSVTNGNINSNAVLVGGDTPLSREEVMNSRGGW